MPIPPSDLSMPATKTDLVVARMERAIYDAVHREIQLAREEIEKKAVQEFQSRIRQIVGRITLDASNFYTVHRDTVGHELVIRVKIEDGDSRT